VLTDLLLAHPLPKNLHIIPTTRDPHTHLALSSRNVHLSPSELAVAPVLYRALSAARETWQRGGTTGEDMIASATQVVLDTQQELKDDLSGVELRMDYFEVFDKSTFEPVRGDVKEGREMVMAGAVWVGGTRLIDNLLLGWEVG
jgi:pantoate--beta-alanine ligase